MKILMCHNHYQQPGGEDRVFDDECRLLESRGHQVIRFEKHNDALDGMSRLSMIKNTFRNAAAEGEVRDLIQKYRPDVLHCHNTFPLISPAVYRVAKNRGTAVVQTLHNYRLLCPAATLMRNGSVCEKCISRSLAVPGIVRGCYRGSRAATAVTAAMVFWHRLTKTWTDAVDRYIALTDFSREKFIQGGLPADRICVKPNLAEPDPGVGRHRERCAVFAGRLSEEKGVQVLLKAWSLLQDDIPLKILGDGPLSDIVAAAAAADSRISTFGHVDAEDVLRTAGDAALLVMPSVCYETFGRTIVEAFAVGTPVVASRTGAMQELIRDGETGLLFDPGNADDLAEKVRQLWNSEDRRRCMGEAARDDYERLYTAEPNYRRLIQIYEEAVADTGRKVTAPEPVPV